MPSADYVDPSTADSLTEILKWHADNLSAAAKGYPHLRADADTAQALLRTWQNTPAGQRQHVAASPRVRGLISRYHKATTEQDHDKLMTRYRDQPRDGREDQVGIAQRLSGTYVRRALDRGEQAAAASVVSVSHTAQQDRPAASGGAGSNTAVDRWLASLPSTSSPTPAGMGR